MAMRPPRPKTRCARCRPSAAGVWNSAANVVELQRAVMDRSTHHALCMDKRKLGETAPALLAKWADVDQLITELPHADATSAGVNLAEDRYLQA